MAWEENRRELEEKVTALVAARFGGVEVFVAIAVVAPGDVYRRNGVEECEPHLRRVLDTCALERRRHQRVHFAAADEVVELHRR